MWAPNSLKFSWRCTPRLEVNWKLEIWCMAGAWYERQRKKEKNKEGIFHSFLCLDWKKNFIIKKTGFYNVASLSKAHHKSFRPKICKKKRKREQPMLIDRFSFLYVTRHVAKTYQKKFFFLFLLRESIFHFLSFSDYLKKRHDDIGLIFTII